MKSVFVITSEHRVYYGHGDYGNETQLNRKGSWGSDGLYPAFTTKEKAEEYLRKEKDSYSVVTELKLEE